MAGQVELATVTRGREGLVMGGLKKIKVETYETFKWRQHDQDV